MSASRSGYVERVASLITVGVDVNITDSVRYTQYLLFCVSLHMSVITQDGDSALMIAIREGRNKVVSLLLEAGANIHIQNKVKCVQEDKVLGRECGRYNMCIHEYCKIMLLLDLLIKHTNHTMHNGEIEQMCISAFPHLHCKHFYRGLPPTQ